MADRELLEALYNDMQTVKQKVTALELTIENETNRNIREQDMMCPASGVRLHRRIYARGPGTVSKPKGHNNINLRPLLRFPHRQEGNKSKIMSVGKSNLRFLYLYLHALHCRQNFLFKSLIQRQRFRLPVKKILYILIHSLRLSNISYFTDGSLSHNTIRQYQKSILPGPPCCTEAV